jgi:hypothetical protein
MQKGLLFQLHPACILWIIRNASSPFINESYELISSLRWCGGQGGKRRYPDQAPDPREAAVDEYLLSHDAYRTAISNPTVMARKAQNLFSNI